MNFKTVTLDVREDIRLGREPFSRIMRATAALAPDEQLLLIAPFEPVPLFLVMEKQGFAFSAKPIASGGWEVLFTPGPGMPAVEATPAEELADSNPRIDAGPASIVQVDARGLEPPQPMVKILETLATLPAGSQLRARTDRRPLHLYPQLEARGFAASTEQQSDGSFLTHICRR